MGWTANRIAEHVRTHKLPGLRIILHGGEPLLAGRARLSRLITTARAALPASCAAEICMQTNGILLNEATLRFLHDNSISVGVSLDGGHAENDQHRVRPDGRGTYHAVRRALRLLNDARYRSSYAGILATVDPDTDPVGCYEELLGYAPPAVDFLLPHANWATPPARRGTPYGDWLVAAFDRWYAAPRQETRVRLFEDVIKLTLGGRSGSEQIGLSPAAMVVIETDGAIEQVDSLKSAYPGACETGLNVHTDSLDSALAHPGVAARQIGTAALSPTCLACSVHPICGGGHYAHRYRPAAGFRNPSVYCHDLRRFITHVRSRVAADVARLVADQRP